MRPQPLCTCDVTATLGTLLEGKEAHLCELHQGDQIHARDAARSRRRLAEREVAIREFEARFNRATGAKPAPPEPPEPEPAMSVADAVELIAGVLEGSRERPTDERPQDVALNSPEIEAKVARALGIDH